MCRSTPRRSFVSSVWRTGSGASTSSSSRTAMPTTLPAWMISGGSATCARVGRSRCGRPRRAASGCAGCFRTRSARSRCSRVTRRSSRGRCRRPSSCRRGRSVRRCCRTARSRCSGWSSRSAAPGRSSPTTPTASASGRNRVSWRGARMLWFSMDCVPSRIPRTCVWRRRSRSPKRSGRRRLFSPT